MNDLVEIIRQLEARGGELVGDSSKDITDMEKVVGPIPDPLKEVFSICGKESLGLFAGSEFGLEKMPELREVAIEILQEARQEHLLEEDHCVFLTHLGYEFLAVKKLGGVFEVFHYIEGEDVLRIMDGGFLGYVKKLVELKLKYM